MVKISNTLSPEIVKEIFWERIVSYILRSNNSFTSGQLNSVYHGTESLFSRPQNLGASTTRKDSGYVNIFKSRVRKWTPSHCPFRLCHTYLQHVGFIWN